MKVELYDKPYQFPYLVVDDYYDKEELIKIWHELGYFKDKLVSPKEGGSAYRTDNKGKREYLKTNTCLYIDQAIEHSLIKECNRKTFDLMNDIKDQQKNHSTSTWFFKNLTTNYDSTLISYYENNAYYKSHFDQALVTVLTWLYVNPKKFKGGDLTFTDYDITIECINNRTIMFPSIIKHEVSSIIMKEEDCNKGLGRWCLTQFGTNRDRRTPDPSDSN